MAISDHVIPVDQANESVNGSYLALFLAITMFSFGFIFIRLAALPVLTLVFFRLFLGVASLGFILLFQGKLEKIRYHLKLWKQAVPTALFFTLHICLMVLSLQNTTIAVVTIISAAMPLCVAFLQMKSIMLNAWVWIVISILGMGFNLAGSSIDGNHTYLGDFFSILNLLAFTGYFINSQKAIRKGFDSVVLTFFTFGIASCLTLPLMLLDSESYIPSIDQLIYVAILACFVGNCHVLLNFSHSKVPVTFSSIALSLIPILSSVWAATFLGESYGIYHFLGSLLVIASLEGMRRVHRVKNENGPTEEQGQLEKLSG